MEEMKNELLEMREERAEEALLQETGLAKDNRGVGVVEVILILVVLIALVLIFKNQLGAMVAKAMQALERSINEVLS